MKTTLAVVLALLIVHPCEAQVVENLGVNPETGLEETRVDLPGLPEDATPLEMVLIPAGTFTMGSPADERGRGASDWPPHEVTITQPFYLGKYEISQAQWRAVMGSDPSRWDFGNYGSGDDYPVYYVRWNDCQAFISRLNETGQGTFRLPTDAEWEFACRAGTTTRFSFGDALECDESDGDELKDFCELADQYMWWMGNDTYGGEASGTKEVGRKLPNPWGLYDIHGNVLEWCSDRFEPSSDRGSQTDPQGPTLGPLRAYRGGYWARSARRCRSATRGTFSPYNRRYEFGFRLLRSHEGSSVSEWTAYE